MNIRTECNNFEYQVKEIFKEMKKLSEDMNSEFNSEFLWNNREDLGEYFFNAICEYTDIDELIEEIK